MAIYFYTVHGPHGGLSNFSKHGFELDGQWWPTSEHYFQAQKFAGTEHLETVRRASSPKEAARLGRQRTLPLRADWEEIKEEVMRRALRAKFTAHAELRAQLLASGDEELVENSPSDLYWGCGADGTGKNRLGRLLEELRTALRG